jgi:hypothetical protein
MPSVNELRSWAFITVAVRRRAAVQRRDRTLHADTEGAVLWLVASRISPTAGAKIAACIALRYFRKIG